jgi:uncharacterized membrane protein YoaK (UPF0700 family)
VVALVLGATCGRLLPLLLLLLPLIGAAALMCPAALYVLERQDGGWQVLISPLFFAAFDDPPP